MPTLPAYPDDAEGWKAIDLKLAARVLNLRNRIDGSQGLISATIEFAREDLGETLDEQAAGRGLEAWGLAVALRRRHGLELVELIWDFQDTLERTLARAIEKQKKNREARDQFFSEMSVSTADAPDLGRP